MIGVAGMIDFARHTVRNEPPGAHLTCALIVGLHFFDYPIATHQQQ
jgi:hypothetical protein